VRIGHPITGERARVTETGESRLAIGTFSALPDLLADVFEPELQSAVRKWAIMGLGW
jgi:hypothetical protein